MTERAVILSGFGGQGLLFAGQVVAEAALAEGRHVTWLPSYGPEMRGGSASCTVIVSEAPIGSPVTDEADVVLALTPPSLARFERALRPGGVLVLNASLIEARPTRTDIEIVDAPCSAIAATAGDERVVSVVALGAALARLQLVGVEAIRAALSRGTRHGGAEQLARNLAALDAGLAAGASTGVAA
jgi:2-oxoglutarate ferredoxin oxidoreductase subunit gamma